MVAPNGPMYQAGTLSGNPLAMTAGYETLSIILEDAGFYDRLEKKSAQLAHGIAENAKTLDVPITTNRVGSMSTIFFTSTNVVDYQTALSADTKKFAIYFKEMLAQGVYLAPSQFEAGFVSIAHSDDDLQRTIGANKRALRIAFA